MSDPVNHPAHYGGADDPYEAIKVIEAWGLNFRIGNCVKYIRRAGAKDPAKRLEDLMKAQWYLDREIHKIKPVIHTAKPYHGSDVKVTNKVGGAAQ